MFLASIVLTLMPLPPVTVPPPWPPPTTVVTYDARTEPTVDYETLRANQHARMRGMLGIYIFIAAWFIILGCRIRGGRGGSNRDNPGCGGGRFWTWRGPPH